jgi:hypothetical protein
MHNDDDEMSFFALARSLWLLVEKGDFMQLITASALSPLFRTRRSELAPITFDLGHRTRSMYAIQVFNIEKLRTRGNITVCNGYLKRETTIDFHPSLDGFNFHLARCCNCPSPCSTEIFIDISASEEK